MPIYEFYSSETSKIYSFFARSSVHANKTPLCPDGAKYCMKKLVSGFSITGNRKEPNAEESIEGMDQEDPFSGMSEAQTNAMMQEMKVPYGDGRRQPGSTANGQFNAQNV